MVNVSRRTLLAGFLGAISAKAARAASSPWAVYYSDKAPISSFQPFSTLILDSRYHPPLPPLTRQGKRLIGYVSLGEASPDYYYFSDLQQVGLLLRANPVWQGNYSVDVRDQRWWRWLLDRIIPDVLDKGFHGIFLDTLDTVLYLEQQEPQSFSGMRDAAIELVREIHRKFPDASLILNRAYSILPTLGEDLWAAVGESVFTTYDFATKKYELVDAKTYRTQVELLDDVTQNYPRLRILTLDYWDPDDEPGLRRIYREERSNGFSPYVTSIDLTKLLPEPRTTG